MKVVRAIDARISWMESVSKAAMSRGMVPVLWDTGSEIRRNDGSFSTELQTVMSRLRDAGVLQLTAATLDGLT